jgi:nitroreductase
VKPVVVITVGYASDAEPAQLPATRRRPVSELVRWL